MHTHLATEEKSFKDDFEQIFFKLILQQ